MSSTYDHLMVDIDGKRATVTIDNPPINLMTMAVLKELNHATSALKANDDLNVVVFKSANPDFFVAHFDVDAILTFRADYEPQRDAQLTPFHALFYRS